MPNFLKLDFDKWVDEDDEEDEGNEKHCELRFGGLAT
jgi:hypothetical protein